MTATGHRVRFAPSPTGSLHLGNARTALFNWLLARQSGGVFVLRIEDTDTEREQAGSEAGILEDLRWLGIDWDEGPDVGGPYGPYRQSERAASYLAATATLLERGSAYRCFCTDEDIESHRRAMREAGRTPSYSGRCRGLDPAEAARRVEAGEPFAVRFRTIPAAARAEDLSIVFRDRLRGALEFSAAELGDPVLVRRDGRPTYNFAVVVDDVAMRISLVVRGDDHLSNTPRQVLLYRALGADPPEFAHLPMVRGSDGERLSKRHGATSVGEYRRQGYSPEGVVNALALLGWAPDGDRTILTREALIEAFDIDRVSASPAIFDPKKLEWISGQHLHNAPPEALAPEVGRYLVGAGFLPPDGPAAAGAWLLAVAEFVRPALSHLDQAVARCSGIFYRGVPEPESEAAAVLASHGGRRVVEALARRLRDAGSTDAATWAALRDAVRNETGLKGKELFHPLRAALTGETSGPELDRLVPLIESGSRLFPERILSLRERVARATAEDR